MTEAAMKDPYLVKRGDTLSAISKASGKPISELKTLNKLGNVNQLEVGQTLYLSQETAFGVSVLFLDALRHPIENLVYKIRHDGQTKAGKTQSNGSATRVTTKDAKSRVEVLVQDLQGQWVNVCNVTSDYGHKLVTLVSGSLVFKGATEEHPKKAPAKPESDKKAVPKSAQPAVPAPPGGAATKNNPSVKTTKTKGKQGQSIIQVGVDIPQGLLNRFAKYAAGEISEDQWASTAKLLDCEPAVLKAFAEVESGGRSSFWRLNKSDDAFIPAILYERHYFSDKSHHKYDATHPDISWSTGYRKRTLLGQDDKKMPDGTVEATDIYSDYSSSYLRLINAFRLDPNAALMACSWGKFQIMGANFALCGQGDIVTFVDKMCTSEASQIELVAQFIRRQPRSWKNPHNKALGLEISLWDAVKSKDWAAIAFNYNGSGYRTYSYDTKLKAAYEKHSQKKA